MASRVEIDVTANTQDAQRDLARLGDQVEQTGDSFRIAGLSLTDLKSGLDMALGAIGPVVDVMKQTVDAASDMNETLSKSSVIFGDASSRVEEFGNTSAAAFGISKAEAISAASNYGNLFVSMGMTGDVAADMSIKMVQLAGDFASFNNVPVAEALDKIRAGLVGEAEPLRAFGVMLDAASVKAEAMALGLSNGKGELDAAAKAQATYSLILKQSTTAQGDAAKTIGQTAGQQRVLEASTKDLAAEVGQNLLPVYRELLLATNKVITNVSTLVTWQNKLKNVLQQHSDELIKAGMSYQDYTREMVRARLVAANFAGTTEEVNYAISQLKGNLNLAAAYYGNISDEGTRAAAAQKGFAAAAQAGTDAVAEQGPKLDDLYVALLNERDAYYDTGSAAKTLTQAQIDLNKSGVALINESMRPLTAEMIYQKAVVGLDKDAALELARAMGLVNEKTYGTLIQMEKLRKELQNTGDIEAYKRALLDMVYQDYLVTIRADFSSLERALDMAAQLNAAGIGSIRGPSYSGTPTTNPTPTPTTPTPEPVIPGTLGAPEFGGKLDEMPSGVNIYTSASPAQIIQEISRIQRVQRLMQ